MFLFLNSHIAFCHSGVFLDGQVLAQIITDCLLAEKCCIDSHISCSGLQAYHQTWYGVWLLASVTWLMMRSMRCYCLRIDLDCDLAVVWVGFGVELLSHVRCYWKNFLRGDGCFDHAVAEYFLNMVADAHLKSGGVYSCDLDRAFSDGSS